MDSQPNILIDETEIDKDLTPNSNEENGDNVHIESNTRVLPEDSVENRNLRNNLLNSL